MIQDQRLIRDPETILSLNWKSKNKICKEKEKY